jgi:hypothetical protein
MARMRNRRFLVPSQKLNAYKQRTNQQNRINTRFRIVRENTNSFVIMHNRKLISYTLLRGFKALKERTYRQYSMTRCWFRLRHLNDEISPEGTVKRTREHGSDHVMEE